MKIKYIKGRGRRQIEGRWLEPGEIIDMPQAITEALLATGDFEQLAREEVHSDTKAGTKTTAKVAKAEKE